MRRGKPVICVLAPKSHAGWLRNTATWQNDKKLQDRNKRRLKCEKQLKNNEYLASWYTHVSIKLAKTIPVNFETNWIKLFTSKLWQPRIIVLLQELKNLPVGLLFRTGLHLNVRLYFGTYINCHHFLFVTVSIKGCSFGGRGRGEHSGHTSHYGHEAVA